MEDNIELTLIKNEIRRLEEASGKGALSIEDIRKLEILLKTRNIVLTGPQVGDVDETDNISDEEVLAALLEPKVTKSKPNAKKTTTKKTPSKKRTTRKTNKKPSN